MIHSQEDKENIHASESEISIRRAWVRMTRSEAPLDPAPVLAVVACIQRSMIHCSAGHKAGDIIPKHRQGLVMTQSDRGIHRLQGGFSGQGVEEWVPGGLAEASFRIGDSCVTS